MPAPHEENRDPLEVLAADFLDRQREGQHPSISEYVAQYPDLAAEIEELFPTIAAMEQLKAHREAGSSGQAASGAVHLERLGDFRILSEIGRGGMGIVYEAFQESLGRHVAVKVLPRQSLLDPKQLQRFEREAQTAARLHHSNIVPLFGVGEQDGYHYIVMQLIRGVSLDDLLAKLRQLRAADAASRWGHGIPPLAGGAGSEAARLARALAEARFWPSGESASTGGIVPGPKGSEMVAHAGDGTLPPGTASGSDTEKGTQPQPPASNGRAEPFCIGPAYWRSVAAIGVQAADALHYAHAHQTLHRDVKPANLLLDSQGVVWITDFGLAKALDQDHVSQTVALAGTLRYMAPEQFAGHLDARSDVYSLGLTLYELLTLQPAFAEISRSKLIRKITQDQPIRPRQLNPGIPRDLETVVLKAISHEPDHRYQSAAELAHDLRRFLEDRPIAARRVSAAERLWRWARRNRAVAALTTSTFVLLVLFAVVTTSGYIRTARERQKAEATSTLALEALDKIFREFAPERTAPASGVLVVGDSGEEITVPAQPVLSKEAASLLEHMLAFYDRLAERGGDDARLRRKVAEANRRVGDIRQRLGHYEEAKAAYLRAIDSYARLADPSGEDIDLHTEIARVHNELGNLHMAMGQQQDGRASYASALAALQEVSADTSGAPQCQYELARTYYFLGRRPFGVPGPFPLAPGGRRISWQGMPGGRFPGDGAPRKSRRPGPGDPKRLFDASSPPEGAAMPPGPPPDLHGPRPVEGQPPPGPHLAHKGEPKAGDEKPHQRPEFAPGSPPGSDRPSVGVSANDGGRDRDRNRDHARWREWENEREQYLQKAIAIFERLVTENPAVPDYRFLLARCYRELGPSWFGRGKSSTDGVDKATKILESLVAEFPDVPDYRHDLSMTYAWLSAGWPVAFGMDDPTAEQRRRQMLDKALAISDELVAEHPNIPDYAAFQVHVRLRLANILWETDPSRAEASLRKALDLEWTLARRFPQNSFYRIGLGSIQESLAVLLRDRGQLADARTLMESCIASFKAVLPKDSNSRFPPMQGVVAQNYRNLANLLRRMNDEQGAAAALRQAEEYDPRK